MATVAFEPEELSGLIRAYTGEGIARDELQEFVESLRRIERAPRALDAVMEQANDYFYGSGVEWLYEPEGEGLMGEGAILGTYIATQERPTHAPGSPPLQSDRTLLYDWRENTFLLTTPDEFWRQATEGEGATHTRGSEHVQMDRGEFVRVFQNQWRVAPPEVQRLYNEMHEAIGMREIRDVLRRIDKAADQFGIESVAPERYAGGRALLYINTGDTYNETIGFDRGRDAFIITTWGGWFEEAEREIYEEGESPRNDEDACETCRRFYSVEELENGVCANCREREKPPTWEPQEDQPLIVWLRSVEGSPIAVHLFTWGTAITRGTEHEEPFLAFSVPLRQEFTFEARDRDLPYRHHWTHVIASIQKGGSMFVCSGQSIEREMFQRLQVALDAFFETGGTHQPVKEFLKVPPVLWTCDQVNEIQWIEGERGHDDGVQAFVRQHHEPGSQIELDDLLVWSAADRELLELITDGFIQWKRDDTVREYLKQIGVCR